MKHFLIILVIFVAVFLLFALVPRGAAGEGRTAFQDHCAACHGPGATGDGPMAQVLGVPPTDLTMLARNNGGAFPTGRVLRRVDGREEVLAHGGPMPLFGLLLEGPATAVLAPDGSEIVTSESLAEIVTWLEGVQR